MAKILDMLDFFVEMEATEGHDMKGEHILYRAEDLHDAMSYKYPGRDYGYFSEMSATDRSAVQRVVEGRGGIIVHWCSGTSVPLSYVMYLNEQTLMGAWTGPVALSIPAKDTLLSISFPRDDGSILGLQLPSNLNPSEAERLARVIEDEARRRSEVATASMIGQCSVCKALSVKVVEPLAVDDTSKRPVGTVRVCLPCTDRIAENERKEVAQ